MGFKAHFSEEMILALVPGDEENSVRNPER